MFRRVLVVGAVLTFLLIALSALLIKVYGSSIARHNRREMDSFLAIEKRMSQGIVSKDRVIAMMGAPDEVISPSEMIPLVARNEYSGSFDSCREVLFYEVKYNQYSIAFPFVSFGPEDWFGYVGIDSSGNASGWLLYLH